MSTQTRKEVLARLRRQYAKARGFEKTTLLDQAVRLLGYHRKAAIRALQKPRAGTVPTPAPKRVCVAHRGRPRRYEAAVLLPALRAIWRAAQQPCGRRLTAAMADWVPAYEQEHRRLENGVREALLGASHATLDRLLAPLRAEHRRRFSTTRPGRLLRQHVPIAGQVWNQTLPGYLEVDTVALCGGSLEGDHTWILDATDYATGWVEVRAQWNRGPHATLCGLEDIRTSLPFGLRGVDADNGGEFMNWLVIEWCRQGGRGIELTRSRPYHHNDNAHVEQKNWTHVRQWFGYERYDHEPVVALINTLTRGALGQLQNFFLPTLKLESKQRDAKGRVQRRYGAAQTPWARVMAHDTVSAENKAQLQALKAKLNPFALQREVERQLKRIGKERSRARRRS